MSMNKSRAVWWYGFAIRCVEIPFHKQVYKIARSSSKMRSASKLKTMAVPDRILLQLPRLGLATDDQLEHIASLHGAGGAKAIQACSGVHRVHPRM